MKNRDWNKTAYVTLWREALANDINNAYKRNGIPKKVNHLSFKKQGKQLQATKHLHFFDYEKEIHGERTDRGDENRAIRTWNAELINRDLSRNQQEIQQELDREHEIERNRMML